MRNAHQYEIAPFLALTADQKKQYNVVAPGKYALTTAELDKVAKEWDAKLAPTDGNGGGGTYTRAARDGILKCWDAAKRGDYKECNWSGADPRADPDLHAAQGLRHRVPDQGPHPAPRLHRQGHGLARGRRRGMQGPQDAPPQQRRGLAPHHHHRRGRRAAHLVFRRR